MLLALEEEWSMQDDHLQGETGQKLRIYQDAVAIITGGASGIGRALGEALSRRGAHVVLADRQIALAEKVAAEIRESGTLASAAEVDVTDFAAVCRVVEDTVNAHGRLDYFFSNAGIGIGGEVRLYQIEDWYQVLDVNLRGVVHGIQAAYPVMLRQGFGHMVNTASLAGLVPTPWSVGYAATKHAVVGLSTSLRIEAAPAGVRVSVLCPGVIQTPILEGAGKYGKLLMPVEPKAQRRYWERLRPMPPDRFATRVLRAIAKNKAIIVVPWWWKAFWWMNRLSPSLGLYVGHKFLEATKRRMEAASASIDAQEDETPASEHSARKT
jgi:NAD(P)-dependent dehydrogenase (short-subunit alcohol dehydrogenase family)